MATIAPGGAPIADHAADSEQMPLGRWLRTTPGLVRLFSIMAVVGLVTVGLLGTGALIQRRDASERVATSSGPELVTASELYASLAAADALASSAFLGAEANSKALRQRYQTELAQADAHLVDLAQHTDLSATAQDAVQVIVTAKTTYAGRVATAQANQRAANPVSAAYMRTASAQMRDEILPAATTIWSDAAVRLQDDYDTGTATPWLVAFAVAGGAVALVLVALSVFLARRTRRLLNVGVLAATLIVLVAGAGSVVLMVHEHQALVRAQHDGSDPVEMLSVAYFLALQGQADANLALAERGTGAPYVEKFQATADRVGGVGGRPGLLDDAQTIAFPASDAASIATVHTAFDNYLAVARSVRETDDHGRHEDAVARALSEDADGLAGAAASVNERMEASITAFQNRFVGAADDARIGSDVMVVALAVALAAAVACVVAGVQPRIGEYR